MRRQGLTRRVRRVITVFGEEEFKELQEYCRRRNVSLYALAKAAVREYVKRHP